MASEASLTILFPSEGLTVIAPLPELLTQKNVEAVTGIPPRTFVALLRRPDFTVSVRKVGRLYVVSRRDFVAWFSRSFREAAVPIRPSEAGSVTKGAPDPVDEMLRQAGEHRAKSPVGAR